MAGGVVEDPWLRMRRTGGAVDIHWRFNVIGDMITERHIRDGQIEATIDATRWALHWDWLGQYQRERASQLIGGTINVDGAHQTHSFGQKGQSDGNHCSVGTSKLVTDNHTSTRTDQTTTTAVQ